MNFFDKFIYFITGHKPASYSMKELNENNNHLGWENWDQKILSGRLNNVKIHLGDSIKVETKTNYYIFKVKKIKFISNKQSKIYLK